MQLKVFLCGVLILMCASSSWAQIQGHVYLFEDEKKSPAVMAEVYWEGSEVGTTTDESGYFEIEKVSGYNRLIASYTGFESQSKMIISRKGTTDFILLPAATTLKDVTVTGEAEATIIRAKATGLHYEIGTKELRKAACCNLSESFETNASIDVSFSDGITGTKQIEMLGLAGKYALIQRENIPFARGLNSRHGMSHVPGPFIQSIQLTKGLSSVINGAESITGQINVEYFKPENAPRLLINAYGNAGGRSEVNALIRSGWKDPAKAENATLLHFSTIPFAQDRNNDGFADITTGRQLNAMHRGHYRIGENWEGQYGAVIVDDAQNGGQLGSINDEDPNDWGFQSREQRYEVFGKNGYVFPDQELRNLGIIYSASHQIVENDFGNIVTGHELESSQSNFYLNTIFHDFMGSLEHQFKTGFSLNIDDVRELARLFPGPFGPGPPSVNIYFNERTEIVPGAYYEYSYLPSDDFSLVAGIRGDYNSLFERLYWSPRVQARYQIHPNTTFRISGGRGQRTPNRVMENASAFASKREVVFRDYFLLPEIAWNSGFSWSQNFIIKDKVLRWNTDVFYTWFESKVVLDLDFEPITALILNRRGSNSLSILSQFDFSPSEKLDLRLAYKYLNSQENFLEGFNYNYQIPLHRAFFNASYEIGESWKVDATLNLFGRKRLPITELNPDEFKQPGWSPIFSTFNTQVNYSLNKFEFFIGADNLFDFRQDQPIVSADNPGNPFFDSNFIWGPIFGRNIYVGLYYTLP